MTVRPDGIEGRIRVRLAVRNGRIDDVALTSTRPPNACSVLEGRSWDEVLRRVPGLFSICGTAQGLAAVTAAEQALGVAVAPPQITARKMLLMAETAQQHGWRMLLDIPRMLGEEPNPVALIAFHKPLASLHRLLYPILDGVTLGGGRLEPEASAIPSLMVEIAEALDTHILGPGWENTEAWIAGGKAPAARWLRAVRDRGWSDLGRCAIDPLPALDAAELNRILAADRNADFVARPLWRSAARETGPLARQAAHPLIAPVTARHGNGLFSRSLARLVELVATVQGLAARATALAPDPGGAEPGRHAGNGLGVVEAARGRLVHRLEIAEDRVRRFQILAPTEWNFHPQGPLAQGLRGLPAEDAKTKAQWLAAALDPCVACDIEVADA